MPLDPVLARIPGLAGVLASQDRGQSALANELAQYNVLQQIAARSAEMRQREQALADEHALRAGVAQSGGDLEKAMEAALRSGRIDVASKIAPLIEARRKAALPQPGQSIGSGGLRLPDGTIIPPAARPEKEESWSDPYEMNGAMVQKNIRTGQIRTAVTREPQVRVSVPPPVTAVTIQDPNDPTGTVVIDGRTRQVLGRGPKLTEAGKIDRKTDLAMQGLGADIQAAEDLLMGVVRTPDGQIVRGNKPTGSVVGSLVDKAGALVGVSPDGAEEASQLKVVSARLVGRIPRFEGPQSDRDTQLYREAAADVGNDGIPTGRRLAALRRMKDIYKGYESGERGRIIGNRRAGDASPAPVVVDW